MQDEQDGEQRSDNYPAQNPEVFPSRSPSNAEQHGEDKESSDTNNEPEYFKESTVKRKWQEFKNAGMDRHFELALTFAIVIFAACQLVITILNSRSSAEQLRQIIASGQSLSTSADRVDDAAESFSKSSADISRSMSDAVAKLQAQASQMEDLAKATRNANKIAEDAVKLQVSGYNPYLVISDVSGHGPDLSRAGGPPADQPTNFFVTKDKISIQFYVTNSSPGEAKNIHFAVSKAYPTRGGLPAYMLKQDIESAMNAGVRPLTDIGKIDDLEGHIKTEQPVIFDLVSAAPPQQMLMSSIAQWFYGEMYWDSELGSTHGWEEGFCYVIQTGARDGGQTITPCGVHEEGVHPRKAQDEQHKSAQGR